MEGSSSTSARLLPRPPPSLLQVQTHPLEGFLEEFVNTVEERFSKLEVDLTKAKATIASLEDKQKGTYTTLQALQQVVAANATQHVTKATMSIILKKLSTALNDIDPTAEGDDGVPPFTWLATSIAAPADSKSSPVLGNSTMNYDGTTISSGSPSPRSHRMMSVVQQALGESRRAHLSSSPGSPGGQSQSEGLMSASGRAGGAAPSAVAGATVAGGSGETKLRTMMRSEIAAWQAETNAVESEQRRAVAVADLTRQVTALKDSLVEKVNLSTMVSAMEIIKADAKGIREELAASKRKQAAAEKDSESAMDAQHAKLLAAHQHTHQRFEQLYDLFGLQESSIATPAIITGGGAGTDGAPLSLHGSTNMRPSLSLGGSLVNSRSTTPTRRHVNPAASPTNASEASGDDDGVDSGAKRLLRCTAFVALRQRILDDIVERIASSRHAQSSDVGLELYTIRTDIKQRPTTQRVIEIITEQVNVAGLIARCDGLSRNLTRIERETVKEVDFNMALKTKVEMPIVEERVHRDEFTAYCASSKTRLDEQDGAIQLIMSEREEISKIFKEIVAFHKREMIRESARGGGAAGHHGSSPRSTAHAADPSGMFHFESHDDADRQLQAILEGTYAGDRTDSPRVASNSRMAPPSRTSRKGASSLSNGVRPITEGRTQSQNIPLPPNSRQGGSSSGTAPLTSQREIPLSPRTPKADPVVSPTNAKSAALVLDGSQGPALPMTANQIAYARVVSEDQLRSQIGHLPPLPHAGSSR